MKNKARRYLALATFLLGGNHTISIAADTTSNAATCPVTHAAASTSSMMGGTSDPNRTDEISQLDKSFQDNYAEAKKQIRSQLGPVIIVASDVILLKNGKRESLNFIPEEYTVTKTVDHITLDIFVILTNEPENALSDAAKSKLKTLLEFIDKTRPEVDKSGLPAISTERQHHIMELSKQFIKTTLENNKITAAQLQAFTRSISRMTLDNVDEAVAVALAKFDGIIQTWRKQMTADEWKHTHAIVVSGHMPRIQNSSMLYLLALFKQKQEGERVIYFEGDYDEEKNLDLLVTHILDRRIAIDFYADPWRMHRDLLSDGTKKYLKKHPPKTF